MTHDIYPPEPGSKWRYVGKPESKGDIYMVMSTKLHIKKLDVKPHEVNWSHDNVLYCLDVQVGLDEVIYFSRTWENFLEKFEEIKP